MRKNPTFAKVQVARDFVSKSNQSDKWMEIPWPMDLFFFHLRLETTHLWNPDWIKNQDAFAFGFGCFVLWLQF